MESGVTFAELAGIRTGASLANIEWRRHRSYRHYQRLQRLASAEDDAGGLIYEYAK